MHRNPDNREPGDSSESLTPSIDQIRKVHGDFRLEENDYAEDAPNNGEVYPLIQRRLLELWKTGVPAIGSWYINNDGEKRYGIFVKEVTTQRPTGIIAGKAVVGATVRLPPLPPIHHQ